MSKCGILSLGSGSKTCHKMMIRYEMLRIWIRNPDSKDEDKKNLSARKAVTNI
jgi:hypothetical protein